DAAPGHEDPGCRTDVAGGRDPATLVDAPETAGEEVVHLAHVSTHEPADLGILARLCDRLHPQAREQRLQIPHRRRAHAAPRLRRPQLVDLRLQLAADATPGLVQAREVEIALRREVAVQDRLGDTGFPRDLRSRRSRVAPVREDVEPSVDDRGPALGSGESRGRRLRHAASSGASRSAASSSSWGRTSTKATIAPTAAMTAATMSALWKPSMKAPLKAASAAALSVAAARRCTPPAWPGMTAASR